MYPHKTQCLVGTSLGQRVCLQNYHQQTPICCNPDQKFRFSLVTFFIFVYQTVNRGDHRKVPINKNVNIWKNANNLDKRVKLLKLRTEKCSKDISLLTQHNMFFKTSNLL